MIESVLLLYSTQSTYRKNYIFFKVRFLNNAELTTISHNYYFQYENYFSFWKKGTINNNRNLKLGKMNNFQNLFLFFEENEFWASLIGYKPTV